jgi:hypothetical protein
MERTPEILGFAAIFGVTIAGMLHAPWWAACAGASLLLIASLRLHQNVYARLAQGGSLTHQSLLALTSLLNAITASAVAFGLGWVVAWSWGL